MDYFDRIQKAIDFIEERITEELPLVEVAREAYCSLYHFHRMFQGVVGDSVKEYIRKRRLSLAGRELASTGEKVVDVALKYGYETPEAFAKAFKKFHGLTPVLCRQRGSYSFREKAFVRIYKAELLEGGITMDYKIVEKDAIKVVGPEIRVRNDNGDNFKLIPQFWTKCIEEGTLSEFGRVPNVINKTENVCLGICMDFAEDSTFSYVIGVEVSDFGTVPAGMVAKTIPAQKYAVFTARGKMPDSIHQTWKDIYGIWFPESGHERTDGPDFEYYDKRSETNDDNAEVDIYIPIK